MNRRWVYGALLALAVVLLLGTGGFSAISADRGVSVAVTGNDDAYLGYETACHNGTLNITITNRFDETLTDGSVAVDGNETELPEIKPSESATVTFDVSASDGQTIEPGDPVTVEASGSGISVELDRTVPEQC